MFPTCEVGNIRLSDDLPMWETSDMAEYEPLEGVRLYDAFMAIKPPGLAETEWALRAGVNRGFFGNLKGKSKNPRHDTIRKLLQAVGATEADLRPAPPAPKAGRRLAVVVPDQPPVHTIDRGEAGEVAKINLSLPMGPGATVDEYVEEEPLIFDLAYIRSFTRAPLHHLRIAQGIGDSMFPTLVSNDLVWIDTTQNQLVHADRIYAASINGGATIKRLRPIDGGRKVLVISDNKAIESYEVDAEDVRIWGRIIRFARDL